MNSAAHSSGSLWLAVALAPALAVSDLGSHALGLGVVMIVLSALVAAVDTLLKRLPEELRWLLISLVLAAAISSAALVMSAWRHDLFVALSVFLPLLAANLALHRPAAQQAWGPPLQLVATSALLLFVLGLIRELVGRGSLFHDAAALGTWIGPLDTQLFRADMGFLLAMLPPGAFIACGLLLAGRNWLTRKR